MFSPSLIIINEAKIDGYMKKNEFFYSMFFYLFTLTILAFVTACSSFSPLSELPATSHFTLEPSSTLEPSATLEPTSTSTDTPRPTATLTSSPTAIKILNNVVGRIKYHKIDGADIYNYYSYIPRNLDFSKKIQIVISPAEGQCKECCDVEIASNNVKYHMEGYLHYADKYNFVLLFPVIHNNCDGLRDNWTLHFPDFVFSDPVDSTFYRPDLKLNASIDNFKASLVNDGLIVDDKVYIFGFSIGGLASNKYSILQPSYVSAFAAGGTAGDLCFPVDSIDGYPLNWAWGTNNFESLVGTTFNQEEYNKISQFLFFGDKDFNNYHLQESCNLGGTDACHWKNFWGSDMVSAFSNQCKFLQDLGLEVTCKLYPDKAHEFNDEMINDVFEFFHEIRSNNN